MEPVKQLEFQFSEENSFNKSETTSAKDFENPENSPHAHVVTQPDDIPLKTVLGLDIGTNSIGAALIKVPRNISDYTKAGSIVWMGCRTIPTDGDYLQKFESGGQVETKTAARRMKRGARRLKHRYKLRRERLTKVFKILGWVQEDFPMDDPGKIKDIIREMEGRYQFKMSDYLPFTSNSIEEAMNILEIPRNTEAGNSRIRIPEDWVIYYIRSKALEKEITVQELARILYILNQRRGFKSNRKDLRETDTDYISYEELKTIKEKIDKNEISEYLRGEGNEIVTRFVTTTTIKSVEKTEKEHDKKGNSTFKISVVDERVLPWEVKRREKPNWEGAEKTLLVEQKINTKGEIKQEKAPKFPEEDDWALVMTALDEKIQNSGKTVGKYFWDSLVEHYKKGKVYKIRQNTVNRRRYIEEITQIWNKQLEIRREQNREIELLNNDKLETIVKSLYKNNVAKQAELIKKGLFHILVYDIIYYQRELKSQKYLINECRLEKRVGKRKISENEFEFTGLYGLKCCPKSSPLFQEFRIWQGIHNLRIYQKEKYINNNLKVNYDVTYDYINDIVKEELFKLFNEQAEISQKNIFNVINKIRKSNILNEENFFINLFANQKVLKGEETKHELRKIFKKYEWVEQGDKLLLHNERYFELWNILYSIKSSDLEKSKKGILTALNERFSEIPTQIKNALANSKEFPKEYAAYSSCAIKKLLALMRTGNYWNEDDLSRIYVVKQNSDNIKDSRKITLRERIDDIIAGKLIPNFKNKKLLEEIQRKTFSKISDFSSLPTWLASYVIYGVHSERENSKKYNIDEIKKLSILNIQQFRKLNCNPIVKQVVAETIHLVKDVCLIYEQPDEIHIELARELKKNSKEKRQITELNRKNYEERRQAQIILSHLFNEKFRHYNEAGDEVSDTFTVNPNPNDQKDQDKFRLYKSCAAFEWIDKDKKTEDEIRLDKIFKFGAKEKYPTKDEITDYILWLSQKCKSPYTGNIIPLSKLFDGTLYDKDHIIPRSKLKYDSLDNLVIAEKQINEAKRNELAANFIRMKGGTIENGFKILKYEDYVSLCKKTYKGKKLKNLLATDIPDDFIERQINDTRYIGRVLGEILQPFAKDENGLVFTIGAITDELKNNWGLNKIWKQILKPRFQRLEEINGKKYIQESNGEISFYVSENDDPNLNLKRLDHRHHALDALVIAATSREHIRYLNTLNAADTDDEIKNIKLKLVKQRIRDFVLPWPNFSSEAKKKLEEMIVSFKVCNRVLSKPSNFYERWVLTLEDDSPKLVKIKVKQERNQRWVAVRKSLFKEPQGVVILRENLKANLSKAILTEIERISSIMNHSSIEMLPYINCKQLRKEIKLSILGILDSYGISMMNNPEELAARVKEILLKNRNIYYDNTIITETTKVDIVKFERWKAKRVALDSSFKENKIKKIPNYENSPLAKLLLSHLKEHNNDPKQAFAGEGLEKLYIKNGNLPINRLTITDGKLEDKHAENLFGNKFMENDKGSIVYFVIYESKETKQRIYESISVFSVVDRYIKGLTPIPPKEGYKIIIVLQPNDLVYVPTDDEWEALNNGKNVIDWNNKQHIASRIYKLVSADDSYFIQHHIARPIIPSDTSKKNKVKGEIDWHNKSKKMLDNKTDIASRCIKLRVERLGNFVPLI